jgi:hypothetical protein
MWTCSLRARRAESFFPGLRENGTVGLHAFWNGPSRSARTSAARGRRRSASASRPRNLCLDPNHHRLPLPPGFNSSRARHLRLAPAGRPLRTTNHRVRAENTCELGAVDKALLCPRLRPVVRVPIHSGSGSSPIRVSSHNSRMPSSRLTSLAPGRILPT